MEHKRLRIEEREQIALLLGKGKGYREIGRIHSTIIRDVKLSGRNSSRYTALHAQKLADKRNLLSGRKQFVDIRPEIFINVFERLFKCWSLRQISEDLKRAHPEESHGHGSLMRRFIGIFIHFHEECSRRR